MLCKYILDNWSKCQVKNIGRRPGSIITSTYTLFQIHKFRLHNIYLFIRIFHNRVKRDKKYCVI